MVSHPPEVAGLKNGNLGVVKIEKIKKKKKIRIFPKKTVFCQNRRKCHFWANPGFWARGRFFRKNCPILKIEKKNGAMLS